MWEGRCLGQQKPSLGQTNRPFLFSSTVTSPFCPVCPWDGWGFVPATIDPQAPSEKCLCVLCFPPPPKKKTEGPAIEKFQSQSRISILAWNFQSQLKISISLEIPDLQNSPTKNRGLAGGSLEMFNPTWTGNFQVTVCGVTVCPFSRHKGNQRPKCL